MPHAYTEDQQPQRTLTRPLPTGEEVEQPAIGLFAEQSALPNPQPDLAAALLPRGEERGDEGAQLPPPEAILAAFISGKGRVLPRRKDLVLRGAPTGWGGLGLIEWWTAGCRKSFISRQFLFE